MTGSQRRDEHAETRRRIHRKATLYTYGFMLAAIGVAFGGSALVAWLLSTTGLPFVRTWIVLSVVVLLPSLLGIVWRALRERSS
jgi:FtsH-binding integral membrane protein